MPEQQHCLLYVLLYKPRYSATHSQNSQYTNTTISGLIIVFYLLLRKDSTPAIKIYRHDLFLKILSIITDNTQICFTLITLYIKAYYLFDFNIPP